MAHLPTMEIVADRIHIVRSQRVMLDADLAALYGVPTKRLNEQVRRNSDRFPGDFMFRLSAAEWGALNRSQIATGSQRHRDPASLPNAFTEHGCLMLRGVLAANTELAARVDQLALHIEKHDRKVAAHDQAILSLLAEIRRLTRFPESSSRPIGFTADLSRTSKGRKS